MQRQLTQIASRLTGNRWIVFAVTAIVAALATGGQPRASRDTIFYRGLSDAILNSDLATIFTTMELRWTTLTLVSLVSIARLISAEHWMTIVMIVNIACSGLTAVLLVSLVRRLTGSALAAAAALLLYVTCLDVILWVRFILTDIIYSLIAFSVFFLVADGILGPRIKRRRLLLGIALVAALFTRAVGIVLIPLALFAELILARAPDSRPRWLRGRMLVAGVLLTAAAAMCVRAYVVEDPKHWPFDFIRPKINEYIAREKTGEVVWDRPETFRPPPHTMTDHLVLQADRTVRFFQFTSSQYTRVHNLVNVAYYVPLYLLALIGLFDGLRHPDRRRRGVILAATLWVLAYSLYHGLTLLDFDWRYRAPLMLHMIVLGACGIDVLARLALRRGTPSRTAAIQSADAA